MWNAIKSFSTPIQGIQWGVHKVDKEPKNSQIYMTLLITS